MNDKMVSLQVVTDTVVMQYEETAKVAEAAKEAALKEGYPADNTYVFVLNGEELQPERTLESYHLKSGDVVTLATIISLNVVTGKGTVVMQYKATATVAEAAKEAALKEGYPADNTYVFVLNGEELQPERTLESYHLKSGDVVTLTARGDGY